MTTKVVLIIYNEGIFSDIASLIFIPRGVFVRKLIILPVLCVVFGYGVSSADVIHVPGDYPTIQQGIDAANEHDTVLVKPGVYVENIDFIGKNIVVASLLLTSGDPEFIEATIIDGDSAGSVVTFENEEDTTATITGFTIRHGYSSIGAGIYCDNSGPNITGNIICQNHTWWTYETYAGGIYCSFSAATIENNIIERNRACYGAGICCYDSHVRISGNILRNNSADP